MSTALIDGEQVTVLVVTCRENPDHPRVWIEGDPDECYPVACLYCQYDALHKAHVALQQRTHSTAVTP